MAEDRTYPRYQIVDGFVLPEAFSAEVFRDALRYQPKDDDLFIVTPPKCGTTWSQMILYLLYHDGKRPTSNAQFFESMPFLEMFGRKTVEDRKKPGAIKVHLPYQLTPKSDKAKYIFVVRNPKDACVSFFHHTRRRGYCFEDGDFDTYFDIYLDGRNDFGDYFDLVLSWYDHRHDPNVLFLYYEDMKKDLREQVLRIASFVDPEIGRKVRNDPELLERIARNSSLDSMKFLNEGFQGQITENLDISNMPFPEGYKHFLKFIRDNPYNDGKVNDESKNFIRKGIVGDWRNTFSEKQNAKMNAKIELKLKGTEMYQLWNEAGNL